MTGVINQLPTMFLMLLQSTEWKPAVMQEKPTIAPTIECVVETGQPILEAINNQAPEAKSAAIMPKTKTSGWLMN